MGQKEIVSVDGGCLTKNRSVGFQFIKYNGLCEAAGSFTVTPGGPSHDAGELTGKFVIGQSFRVRGCKVCGNKYLFQCCECKKLVCYDGKEQRDITCPVCGKKSSVPAAKDDRIVMSGKATGGSAEIILAMDVSGSMGGGRIQETKRGAINDFIHKFKGSNMALVTFGNNPNLGPEVKTVVDFTTDTARIEAAVSKLNADWGTPSPLPHIIRNFSGFLGRQGGNRYVVIFTDGEWVSGNHVADANAIKGAGVKIIAIGCAGANQSFLASIASPGASIVATDGKIGQAFATAASITGQG